jgi:cytochrome c peroxidase
MTSFARPRRLALPSNLIRFGLIAFMMIAAVVVGGCTQEPQSNVIVVDSVTNVAGAAAPVNANAYATEELSPRVLRRFAALNGGTDKRPPALVALGRMLYYDARLSKTNQVSCNSCHPLDQYGTTPTSVSTGVHGQKGTRNAPSTYHAAGHFAQFWDGRAKTIEEQATMPILNEREMGMKAAEIVATLGGIEGYRQAFAKAFPGEAKPISFEHVGEAIGAFEHGLVTPARWDRYLRGERDALNAEEKAGAKLFANLGCIVCHTGPYVGGSMFEHVGARVPWPTTNDKGRSSVTGNHVDDMVFKVPSLRNVAKTAPYFHDGSAATLNEAVRMMAHHQLGVELEDDEARELEAWLGSLTGDIPTEYIRAPELPGA